MRFHVHRGPVTGVSADVLVLFGMEGVPLEGGGAALDRALDGQLARLLQEGDLPARSGAATPVYTLGKLPAKRLLFIGLGKPEGLDFARLREAAGRAAKEARKLGARTVAIVAPHVRAAVLSPERAAHAVAEGFCLGAYRYRGFRKHSEPDVSWEAVSVVVNDDPEAWEVGLRKGAAYASGTVLARDLTNLPGNVLTPTALAQKATEVAERHGLAYEVLDAEALAKLGMGGIVAVGKGSAQPPTFTVLRYQGRTEWADVTAYIGKGVTFDTGGICLKPRENMHEMIGDMGGAAAVLGALDAIAALKLPVNLLALIPAAENSPSGTAFKPGDVITMLDGRTVEIRNTDAEGRLLLADAVTYARRQGAKRIVDVATLTGGVIVALGDEVTGLIANDDAWADEVLAAGRDAGELLWRLPNFPHYYEKLKSPVADLNNAPGRKAHPIMGGLFVGVFAEDTPWAHLDIAGTSWADQAGPLHEKGATGAGVRTLVALAERLARSGSGAA